MQLIKNIVVKNVPNLVALTMKTLLGASRVASAARGKSTWLGTPPIARATRSKGLWLEQSKAIKNINIETQF